ncbi:MAG: type II secretion system protein [Planctomycetia bacterium]|nr:type II secretion system protein [Planctomycetia bacterium]
MQTLNRFRTSEIRNPKSEIALPVLPPLARGGQGGSRTRSLARRARRTGAGFTLVEMLVVIVIIGVLMGLAVPVFMQSRVRVNEAAVAMEIKGLESAVSAFKAKYGVEPPSQFRLWLTQAGWNSDPASMATVRRIWPQFDFSMGGGAGTAYPWFWASIATTGGGNPVLNMNSGECLMFFLGGVIPAQGPNQAPVGFSKNPSYPFAPITPTNASGTPTAGAAANSNREGPFFEMANIARIKDSDGNGINEWYDSIPNQTRPYLYFSSYEGGGYRIAELPSGGTLLDVYRVWSPPTSTPNATPPVPGTATQSLPAQKPQTFQIISPGYDGDYGYGGVHNDSLPNSGLQRNTATGKYPDADNITNFSGGRLVK